MLIERGGGGAHIKGRLFRLSIFGRKMTLLYFKLTHTVAYNIQKTL